MIDVAVSIALLLVCVSVALSAWRLAKGPTPSDRVLALDTLYINATALIVLYGIHLGRDDFFEAALLISLLGFVSTVALAKFLLRGRVIE